MIRFWSLEGQLGYEEANEFQKELLEFRARDLIPDTILFLEHRPVITQGRGLQKTGDNRPRHMELPPEFPRGIEFVRSERGGDLTYHGPGQLVCYPIVKLAGENGFAPRHDVVGFIRQLESVLIESLESLGLSSFVKEKATGVWVREGEFERKIASIGIAVRKWVIYHGIAVNIVNDLDPFYLFSPCGFQSEVMTNLSEMILDFEIQHPDWRGFWENQLARRISEKAGLVPRPVEGKSLSAAKNSLKILDSPSWKSEEPQVQI